MKTRLWQTAVERAGRLAAPLALDEVSDADLLGRFLAARDEPAFAALVRRHGPLVWGVCRGLSPSEADAEDAFQATFLALVRSAGKVRQPNALGAWLHRVAGRVCRNGLRAKARRARRERAAAVAEAGRPVAEAAWDRWQAAVHEEIDRLPDSLRVPFVLCVLAGVRQGEAARRLGWKLGTVSGRVCLAKQALAEAVGRRGLTGPAVLAALAGGGMLAAPVAAGLAARGAAVVRPGVSTSIHELARGATGGAMSKFKLLAAVLLAGALTVGAVGTRGTGTAEAQTAGAAPPAGGGPPAYPPAKGGGSGKSSSATPPGMGGFGSLPSPQVEYRFETKPGGPDPIKGLLTRLGKDGWEYVGVVPGADELIFKRVQRNVVGGGVTANPGGFGGFPGGGFGGNFGGGPGMLGGIGGGMSGGNLPGAIGPPPSGSGPGGVPPGGEGVMPGGAPPGGGNKPGDLLDLRRGETIRQGMGRTIDRVHVQNPKVAEVTLDPTNAKRVIIKTLEPGSTQVELTDEGGGKLKVTVRVR